MNTYGQAQHITESMDIPVEEMLPLGSAVQVFGELFEERTRFKAELEGCSIVSIDPPDPWRFERGAPLLTIDAIIDSIGDSLWHAAAAQLIPVMEGEFPGIGKELEAIGSELLEGRLNPRPLLKALFSGSGSETAREASRIGTDTQTLAFALRQIAGPLIERTTYTLRSLIENLSWTKGYCPLCGSMPEVAFLEGESGVRVLRCASCGYEWRFTLLRCPFCENENYEDFEIFFLEGREYESVDACLRCRRYVGTIDTVRLPKPFAREMAAMALMHLDVIAQKRGLLPAGGCTWGIVRERDVFSVPA